MDTLFSSGTLSTIVICAILLGFTLLAFLNPFKKKKINYVYKALMYALPVIIIISAVELQPKVWGFGYVANFQSSLSNSKYICLFDLKISGDDAGPDRQYLRVHIVDANTGKRFLRKMLGENQKPCFIQDNILVTEAMRHIKIWRIPDCELIKEYTESTLPQLYKEFETGVDDMQYNENSKMIEARAKDGKTWFIKPVSGEITNERPKWNKETPVFVKLESINSDYGIKYIKDKNNTVLNSAITFLEGRLAAVDNIQKCYYIVSYKTTDKANPILTCMSFEHNKLWQSDQESLKASDTSTELVDISVTEIVEGAIVFSCGGFIYKVEAKNGNVVWKNRL